MDGNRSEPYEFVRTAVMLATLVCLVAICIYLVVTAFGISPAAGIRSTAGIILPLVIGGFLAVFNRGLLDKASKLPPAVAFPVAAAFGIVVMLLLQNIGALRTVPVAELIVSAGLTTLLYAPGSMPGITQVTAQSDVWVAYYFGVVSGMLVYVVFMGFPFIDAG